MYEDAYGNQTQATLDFNRQQMILRGEIPPSMPTSYNSTIGASSNPYPVGSNSWWSTEIKNREDTAKANTLQSPVTNPYLTRPDITPQEQLGDRQTQELIRSGYSPEQALTLQKNQAQGAQAIRYYENERQKALQSNIGYSSAYHAWAKDTGIPQAPNPYEYAADLSLYALKGTQGKDAGFTPVNPSVLNLPGGKGVQDVAWDKAVANDKNRQFVDNYNFSPAMDTIAAAKANREMGPYGQLGSYSSTLGNLSLKKQQEIGLQAAKTAGWNPRPDLQYLNPAAQDYQTVGNFKPISGNLVGGKIVAGGGVTVENNQPFGTVKGMTITSLELASKGKAVTQPTHPNSVLGKTTQGVDFVGGALSWGVNDLTFGLAYNAKYPGTNQSILPTKDLGPDWKGRERPFGEFSNYNIGASDWLVSLGAVSPETSQANFDLQSSIADNPNRNIVDRSYAWLGGAYWLTQKEIVENPAHLPIIAAEAYILDPLFAGAPVVSKAGLLKAGIKEPVATKISQYVLPTIFTTVMAGETTRGEGKGWFSDFSARTTSQNVGRMLPGVSMFIAGGSVRGLERPVYKYVSTSVTNAGVEIRDFSVAYKNAMKTPEPTGTFQTFIVEGSLNKAYKINTKFNTASYKPTTETILGEALTPIEYKPSVYKNDVATFDISDYLMNRQTIMEYKTKIELGDTRGWGNYKEVYTLRGWEKTKQPIKSTKTELRNVEELELETMPTKTKYIQPIKQKTTVKTQQVSWLATIQIPKVKQSVITKQQTPQTVRQQQEQVLVTTYDQKQKTQVKIKVPQVTQVISGLQLINIPPYSKPTVTPKPTLQQIRKIISFTTPNTPKINTPDKPVPPTTPKYRIPPPPKPNKTTPPPPTPKIPKITTILWGNQKQRNIKAISSKNYFGFREVIPTWTPEQQGRAIFSQYKTTPSKLRLPNTNRKIRAIKMSIKKVR